jgi:hypothetical protein
MSFPISQDHFGKMLGCQVHVAKLSTSHCKCYFANSTLLIACCQTTNSTLANCQLHIVSATLLTFQVDFIFQVPPMFFKLQTPPPPSQNLLVCSMSKIYSLGCPYKIVTGSFSIHHLLHTYPPTSYLPTYPSCYLGPCWEVYNFTSAHFCKLTSVNCQVSKLTHDKSTCTLSHAHWHVFKCTLHIATCMLPSF